MPRHALAVCLLVAIPVVAEGQTLGVYLRGPEVWVPGTPASLRVATHLASSPEASAPVGAVPVEISLAGGGRKQVLWRGTTSATGDAQPKLVVPDWPPGAYELTVSARHAGQTDGATRDIELAPTARLFVMSDKPLYQPGQTLHLRGLAVRSQDGKPLRDLEATLEIEDPRGNRVFYEEGKLSEFGVVTTDFTLADEVNLGDYQARLRLGEETTSLTLRVERYTLPRFKLALTPDRAYYRAGQKVRLAVGARYFFGKPVAKGTVKISAYRRPGASADTLRGETDAAGRLALEWDLAADQAEPVRVIAEVADASGFRQKAELEIPVGNDALAVEIVAEAGKIRPGVEQKLWVIAARPDGASAVDADVELEIKDAGVTLRGKTDALGVAELSFTPARPSRGGCLRLVARVSLAGDRVAQERCPKLAFEPVLLRTDRAIYEARVPLGAEVFAPGATSAWVDVLRDGQIVDGAAVTLSGGHGRVSFPVAPHLGGTLTLHAYALRPDGAPASEGDARVVYVAPPDALRVEVRKADRYLPGEQAKLALKVSDAASGSGVRASVSVSMVDQAVLALRASRPGSTRALITLGSQASFAGSRLAARPGGLNVFRLVDELVADAARQRAARILLAEASTDRGGFEIDPWAERQEAWARQQDRLAKATLRWIAANPPGERLGDKWVWREDLAERMAKTGGMPRADARDPWGRPVSTQTLAELAGLGEFDEWADRETGRRMSAIYGALRGRPPGPFGLGDLAALVAAGKLRRGELRDPWGSALRVVEAPRERTLLGVKSLWVVVSNGPDRSPGNKDDLYPKVLLGGGTCGYPPLEAVDRVAAYGQAMGAIGCGYGYGAGGSGRGISVPAVAIGSATYDPSKDAARVRRHFPETMLWLETQTDERGEATISTTMADSITTWKLSADAIAADGRLGATAVDVKVMQDFFVDVDLPSAVTQGDELSVPVAVHNYLPGKQRVRLAVEAAPWLGIVGPAEQTIELAPDEVGVRHFRIRARDIGRHTLLVRAWGPGAKDAIERPTEVFPDGVERNLGFQARLERGVTSHELVVPRDVVAGTQTAMIKVYPTTATHAIEGLDSILRMPSGCFEQTSSSTYPNLLVLDYLRRSRQSSPAIEKRAKQYITAGYQRLLTFEVKGGGFSWFGDAPANQVLTAYGLEEFYDMKRVYPVDPRVISRTQDWLVREQKTDGGWAPDSHIINDGVTEGFEKDRVRITAFIALALQRTGGSARAVDKAKAFVRRGVAKGGDAYTLALAAELLGPGDPAYTGLVADLWRSRKETPKGVTFEVPGKTPTRGAGKSAEVETTARATLAFLRGPGAGGARSDQLIASLAGAKDTFGSWHSTQSTIRALQAFLRYGELRARKAQGTLRLTVDGEPAGEIGLVPTKEAMEVLALPALTRPGTHKVGLSFEGTGSLEYQIVARWHEPRAAGPQPGDLAVSAKVDRTEVALGDTVQAEITVSARSPEALDMLMVTAGLPPGFDPDDDALARLVKEGTIEKFERGPRDVTFYLGGLPAGKTLTLPLKLQPRFPMRVQMPAPAAWEYYRPERRGDGQPVVLESR